ncbi:hypothetical protein RRH01S_05_02770 [Rhizobium rhizogenes NBRC 13257]|uniref:Uncharacterized protein n=1 Tax=Rhizobium rhizogenes NBRC 13257 TaxID=1220581 RepID=A0AA87QD13_RHIRH|nr:hypothetical protein RRH01S_05_02770 [Rhizobium rhizogenes NBRC 13257]
MVGPLTFQKNMDTRMRLFYALMDWILRRRRERTDREAIQYSADDPWVIQQIEKFERELKK